MGFKRTFKRKVRQGMAAKKARSMTRQQIVGETKLAKGKSPGIKFYALLRKPFKELKAGLDSMRAAKDRKRDEVLKAALTKATP